MIEGFKDKEAEKIFNGEISKKYRNIEKIAKRKLDMLHFAHKEQDLTAPPSNRLESLKGNLKGFYSIRIKINCLQFILRIRLLVFYRVCEAQT